jgi:hypothetical protein
MEAAGNAYTILIRKSEGKRPLGTPRSKWKNDIKTHLKETGIKTYSGLRIRKMFEFCERDNKRLGPITGGKFLD